MFKFIRSYFLRISISRKLLLGYGVLLVLLIIISAYSLINLNWINAVNNSILNSDLPVINAAEKMIDLLLEQEFYAQRYQILRKLENLEYYREREAKFVEIAEQIGSLTNQRELLIDRIVQLHIQYSEILSKDFSRSRGQGIRTAKDYEEKIKLHQEKIIALIRAMAADAISDQKRKTKVTTSIGDLAFNVSAALCIIGFIVSITAAVLITKNVSRALRELKLATSMIARGKFHYEPKIENKDEIGDLSTAFVNMAKKLKRLEQQNLDTSPLTRLPGGVYIEKKLNQRIALKRPIAFCLLDIDHFKSFNDRYGYARGNELIKTTAAIIRKAVIELGSTMDFIGHIGGDDFVIITTPNRYDRICRAIVKTFDGTIPNIYDAGDRQRGYIIGENRQGQKVSFPLASISIAVVTNVNRPVVNYIQFGEISAEIKQRAKATAGSNYVVDQREEAGQTSKQTGKLINLQSRTESSGSR
ncbi:MAG: sensor domain-containing diguanylate cyclase [Deltaproteobacteria bacterium]|nr:sensor domain-containing diguanylate cyclase [Deltaproteobacteria bacterium]